MVVRIDWIIIWGAADKNNETETNLHVADSTQIRKLSVDLCDLNKAVCVECGRHNFIPLRFILMLFHKIRIVNRNIIPHWLSFSHDNSGEWKRKKIKQMKQKHENAKRK